MLALQNDAICGSIAGRWRLGLTIETEDLWAGRHTCCMHCGHVADISVHNMHT